MDTDTRIAALVEHIDESDVTADDLSPTNPGPWGEGECFTLGRREWAVLTDSEADTAWEASLDSYLDECVLPELHGAVRCYFDEEAWKRDARHDGRGHAINSYDGDEDEIQTPEGWAYIYRIN